MKHHEDTWGWMLAADFFLAGMGAATLAIAAFSDLSSEFAVPLAARLAAPVLIAMGAGLLVLELGKPFQGWRVFMNPKAILTFGAWNMTLAIVLGAVKAAFYLPQVAARVPLVNNVTLQNLLSVLLLVIGLIVSSYPGVLLARHVARPFWTGPGIAVLFLLSSLITGVALIQLASAFSASSSGADLRWVLLASAVLQTLLWPLYLYVKRTGTTQREAEAARTWISGSSASAFWLGLFGCGSVLVVAVQLAAPHFTAMSAVFCLVGGATLRYMVVLSGKQRTWIAGEQQYFARLPKGDEAFLKAWTKNQETLES